MWAASLFSPSEERMGRGGLGTSIGASSQGRVLSEEAVVDQKAGCDVSSPEGRLFQVLKSSLTVLPL